VSVGGRPVFSQVGLGQEPERNEPPEAKHCDHYLGDDREYVSGLKTSLTVGD